MGAPTHRERQRAASNHKEAAHRRCRTTGKYNVSSHDAGHDYRTGPHRAPQREQQRFNQHRYIRQMATGNGDKMRESGKAERRLRLSLRKLGGSTADHARDKRS